MAPPESEALDEVRQEIAATKADLAEAKAEGDRELITSYVKLHIIWEDPTKSINKCNSFIPKYTV